MAKTVRKFLIGDLWRIGAHESWFSHMASKGLHLKKVGLLFAHFSKGKPKDIRYRIDTTSNKSISAEQKELYKESGWEYVTNFGEFNVFASAAQLIAPELYTDPAEQSHTLKSFDHKIKINTIYIIVLSAIGIGIQVALWFLKAGPTLTLVQGDGISYITISLMFLVMLYTMLRATFSIRKLRSHLLEGIPINHSAPWKKYRLKNTVFSLTIIIIAAFVTALPFTQMAMQKTQTLPLGQKDLPIVRLVDVEQNPGLVREEFYDENGIDRLNEYSSMWSPFAPLQYESYESGLVSDEVWKDGSGVYSPSIHTQVYKLVFPSMREAIVSDLIARNDLFYLDEELIRQESEQLDTLFISEIDGVTEVFAAKGKGVIYVRYFGYADMEVLLENVKEKIELISE